MPELTSELHSRKLIFCNQCKVTTNHICEGEHLRERTFEDDFWVENWFRLWVCAGCEEATLEVCLLHAGCGSAENYESTYYPKRTDHGVVARRFWRVPEKLRRIYFETVDAFNQGLNILCAAGLRALLEGICEDREMEGKNLQKKIDGLRAILPEHIVKHLHAFRFIGNTALHELVHPEREALRTAIDVAADLLNFLYELSGKAESLSRYGVGVE